MVSEERIAEITKHATEACRIAYFELLNWQIPVKEFGWERFEVKDGIPVVSLPEGMTHSWLDFIEGTEYMRKLCIRVGEDYDKLHETEGPGYKIQSVECRSDEYDHFNDAWRDEEERMMRVLGMKE